MNKTVGILAHVDAGKTTLSEQILYHTNSIRKRGRVDHKNAFLDTNRLEKERGITIFSHQAIFNYNDNTYYLVDTPGHVDFCAEMERVLSVLDYAIIVVSCVEGIQSHTENIWQILRSYHIPTFFFLNKIDRAGADIEKVKKEICTKFSTDVYDFTDGFSDNLIEQLASLDDTLLEHYLERGFDKLLWQNTAQQLIKDERLFPCFCGSALNDIGIDSFLQMFDCLSQTNYSDKSPFSAQVYKVRHDTQGNRLVFLKVTGGIVKVKQNIGEEKINEIRLYHGEKYKTVAQVRAGDLCAVTGLLNVHVGDCFGSDIKQINTFSPPTLTAKLQFDKSLAPRTVLGYLKQLEDEDPMLGVIWEEALQHIQVRVMGKIQLEILPEIIKDRFGIEVEFGECEVLYMETINGSTIGYGHFEPLKHYAEVHLKLEAGKRGSGITFASECSGDVLNFSWQRLIKVHVFERQHKGILTGSPLEDINITLLTGRAHEKHTEGGDFREATYRAIRQGLEQANNQLLEPYYSFSIRTQTEQMGHVLSDLQRMHAVFNPMEVLMNYAIIKGRAPVSTIMNYSLELVSFTKGKGSISLQFDGYEICHNPEEVINRIDYNKIRDMQNTSDSVFCSHGSGFIVKWDEAQRYMHCK